MVEMSQEQSFQVLSAGSIGQRNGADHIASVPVILISDTAMLPTLSLNPGTSTGNEQPVKRKRGRPRKIKPEEQGGQSGPSLTDQQPVVKRGRGRPKKTEQPPVERAVAPVGGPAPVKRGRGRPRKIPLPPTETSMPQVVESRADVTTHVSTDIYNAVQQLAQDAAIVSAIHGTPVQVLPTTAVASMNTIDSPPRPASVSVVVSPTVEDATEWKTPPSKMTTVERPLESGAQGALVQRLQAASTPPLLHAEQPKYLHLLPQCVVTNSVVSVDRVDRLAKQQQQQQEEEETTTDNNRASGGGEVSNDTRQQQQQKQRKQEDSTEEGIVEGTTAESGKGGVEPVKKGLGEQPTEKPEAPQVPAPVKRKRGRPPKNRNPPPPQPAPPPPAPSEVSPSTAQQERPSKESVPSGEQPVTKPKPSVATATDTETVVKRKRGRPPKNPPVDLSRIPKRGRPPKSSKLNLQTQEAMGEQVQVPAVKRGRGRPRKYPIPVVAASGPLLPSVSGLTLPAAGQSDEETLSQGGAPSLSLSESKQQRHQKQDDHNLSAMPVKRKRGRPPKTRESEGPPVKRKRGRPRKDPLPIEESHTPQQQQPPRKRGRPRKHPLKVPPEIVPVTEPPADDEKQRTESLPKRKRGRPRKIPPVVSTLQDPSLSSSADESFISALEKSEDDSVVAEKLTLQISFSDSDSEHSEKLEVQTSAIMALADRVVPPSPSPPRQLDSPLLDPSFEESYDEDSDAETTK